MRNFIGTLTAMASLLCGAVAFASDPALSCQASKLNTVSKYDACRLKAYSKAVRGESTPDFARCNLLRFADAEARADGLCTTVGDQADIGSFVDFCTDSVAVALAGGALPVDCLTCSGDLDACNGNLGGCQGDLSATNADLGACNSNLSACSGSLGTCNSGLATCQANLSSTNSDLGTCNGNLTTANSDLATCQGSLGTATSGTATVGQVLTGRTFTSSAGVGVTGTMPNNGAVSITPGTASQTVAAGYHNGSGSVAGDADLVPGNIKSGVNLFGVTGSAVPSAALKTGRTASYGAGEDGTLQLGVARSFTDNGDGTITDNVTGLTWAKKSNDGGVHDKDNLYNWSVVSSVTWLLDGTVVTNYLNVLNDVAGGGASCFAGHCDWRLPNLSELETLRNAGASSPATYSVFNQPCPVGCTVATCSCTTNSNYWSSSTSYLVEQAWTVNFADGTAQVLRDDGMGPGNKWSKNWHARAVRGG